MNDLLKNLKTKIDTNFTGRINILDLVTSQLLGSIDLNKGKINNCFFKDRKGYGALLACSLSFDKNLLKLVSEPEQVFRTTLLESKTQDIFDKLYSAYKYYESIKGLRPPDNLKLQIVADSLMNTSSLQKHEYDVLCTISDYSKISDIYGNCELFDFEITMALVRLRENKILKVVV